jgi:hypothetical protein
VRYHVVVFLVPDPTSIEQEVIMDEEFDWPESRHKVVDVFTGAIGQLNAESE